MSDYATYIHLENSGEAYVKVATKVPAKEEILTWSDGGFFVPFRNQFSIELTKDRHLMHPKGMYLKHSFTPNCEVTREGLITLRSIEADEALTFDYTSTEFEIKHPFKDKETGRMVE